MLEIRYKRMQDEKEEAKQNTLYIKNKEPLLLKGKSEEIAALFQMIMNASCKVEFLLKEQPLATNDVLASTVCLQDAIRTYGRIRVHEYLLSYVGEANIQKYLQYLQISDKQDCYMNELTHDEKLLLKAFLAFYQQPYLLLIEGNWNACNKIVQERLHQMMRTYLQKGGYVLLAHQASCFYNCDEIYDISSDIPQAQPTINFLEEDIPMERRKTIPIIHIRHWYESYIVQGIKYVSYAILCFLVVSICIGWLLNTQGLQRMIQKQLDQYEQNKQYPISINAVIDKNEYFMELDKDHYEILRNRLAGVDFAPMQYFYLNANGNRDPIYIHNEKGMIQPSESLIEYGTRGYAYREEQEYQQRIKKDYGIPGVYITAHMAEQLGAKDKDLQGYSIHMYIYLPLYENTLSMEELARRWEVDIPIAGILFDPSPYYNGDYYELLMSISLYEDIRNQQQPDVAFTERDDIEEFGVARYLADSGRIVPYTPNRIRVYAESFAEASRIEESLSQGSVQFQLYNEAAGLQNQLQFYKNTAETIRNTLCIYLAAVVAIFFVLSYFLRFGQRRHLDERIASYPSVKVWKHRWFMKMLFTIAMISMAVWMLYACVITIDHTQQLYTIAFSNTSIDDSLLMLIGVFELLLYLHEVPLFYVSIVALATCVGVVIFIPEFIKYLRLQRKQQYGTKKIL